MLAIIPIPGDIQLLKKVPVFHISISQYFMQRKKTGLSTFGTGGVRY
jgi:hypothetical protein